MSQYLLLEISLKNFNANSGFYTVGLPSLTAFAGFFHNIQRKINTLMEKKDVEGTLTIEDFAILAKNIIIREGHSKYIKALKSSDKLSTPASIVDEKIADGDFCFIIKYKENIDKASYSELHSQVSNFAQLFEKLLINTKLAGGVFTIINNKKGLFSSNNFKEVNNKIKHKEYFYLVDESDKLQDKNFTNFIDEISRTTLKKESKLQEKPIKEYYIPIVPGFSLLEEPTLKKDSVLRNADYTHAFVEPILSLARYQSVYSVMYQYRKAEELEEETEIALPKIFWNYNINGNLYYVSASQYQ